MKSASEPPGSAMASIGTSVATPIAPTAAVDRVVSYTCKVMAKVVIDPPTWDSMLPIHSRRKGGDTRKGVTSVSSFTRDIVTALI